MFGREARYPTEVPEEYLVTNDGVEALIAQETQPVGMKSLPAHYRRAQANMGKVREKIKRKREEIGHDDHFKVGQKVMRANIRQEQRKGGKMETSMLGPFTIVKLEGKSADLVTPKSKVIHKVNIDQLSPYIGPTPRIPHKWITNPSSTLSSSPVPLTSSRLNLSTLSSSPVPLISSGLTLISSPIISSPVTLISSRLTVTPICNSVCPFRHFGNR
ncbi:uncharacterized protein LOC133973886 [Platichthys flesus]|uniref:uncharacterized protein LOC133973886 n=1 Tax=Platichthys flesus TaxID=8260 RepID=UPI002DBB811D|nr:uncharacterized protein LOC133973886 [Platichthys flesus]